MTQLIFKCTLLLLIFIHILLAGQFYSLPISEEEKAAKYLEVQNEVYFSFFSTGRSQILELTKVLSIDNVMGHEVFAYANRDEFANFLQLDLEFKILQHPGEMYEIKMTPDRHSGLPYDFDTYPTYNEYVQIMNKYAKDYPDLCRIVEFGKSVDNRLLLAAVISDNVSKRESEPQFYYCSTIHGDETAGANMMLRLMDLLLTSYGSDAQVNNLVDNMEIWITPFVNPDGTFRAGNDVPINRPSRYNKTGQDLNRDFPTPPSQQGNRNHLAQPETKALMKLGDDQRFVMSADLHGGIELACYPWGHKKDRTADDEWWRTIARNYANSAQDNSPGGYFTGENNGIINGYDWYPVDGERMNYALYEQKCRLLTLEVSGTKFLLESQLATYWGYNKEALLNYLEEALFGINGTVVDSNTGEGLVAKVFVENHDKYNSHVFSNPNHGDYYRPIAPGTYKVTYSCDGYEPKTIENITVTKGKATVVNVKLWDGTTGLDLSSSIAKEKLNVTYLLGTKQILIKTKTTPRAGYIYSLNGRVLKELAITGKEIIWDGTNHAGKLVGEGCYILKLHLDKKVISKNFAIYF